MALLRNLILIQLLVLIAPPAHAGFLSGLTHFFSRVPLIGNVVNHYANKKAKSKTNDKIDDLYKDALQCRPLETDDGGITVRQFIKMKPGYPDWKDLEDLKSTANAAKAYAEDRSNNDKVRHCFAGCYIRKKLNYSSAVLAAFLKELQDASDCRSSTHFEMQDYYATIAGAKAGKVAKCESFCGTSSASKKTGTQLLRSARNLIKKKEEKKKPNLPTWFWTTRNNQPGVYMLNPKTSSYVWAPSNGYPYIWNPYTGLWMTHGYY